MRGISYVVKPPHTYLSTIKWNTKTKIDTVSEQILGAGRVESRIVADPVELWEIWAAVARRRI
jgi:hypothetical protein